MRERTRSPATRVAAALFLSVVAACGQPTDVAVPLPADFEAWDTMIVEAIRTAAGAVEAEPREADRWLKLAFVYHGNQQHELALPCYERALELDDESADGWHGLAILRADRGDFAGAAEAMEGMLEIEPTYAPGFWRLGQWALADGRFDEAERWYRDTRVADPQLDNGWIGLVRVHLQRGEAVQAIELIRTRLLAGRNAGYARQLLAQALHQLGDEEQARIEAARGRGARANLADPRWFVIRAHRTGRAAEAERGIALTARGNAAEAIAIFERLLRDDPDDHMVLNNLAQAYSRANRVQQAILLLEQSLALGEARWRPHVNLASAHEKLGRPSDLELALGHALRAVELQPTSPEAHSVLGTVHYRRGAHDSAITSWLRAYELQPGRVSHLFQVGALQMEIQRLDEAIATFERVIEADPSSIYAHVQLYYAHFRAGRFPEAEKILERALELQLQVTPEAHPDARMILIRLGDVYDAQGKTGEAANARQRAAGVDR